MLPESFWLNAFVMAGVTYLVRMLPMVLVRGKITNRAIRSFLYYIPYAVLGAMTFPAVLDSTGSLCSALAGLIVAVVLAVRERGLIIVALAACAVSLLSELALAALQI